MTVLKGKWAYQGAGNGQGVIMVRRYKARRLILTNHKVTRWDNFEVKTSMKISQQQHRFLPVLQEQSGAGFPKSGEAMNALKPVVDFAKKLVDCGALIIEGVLFLLVATFAFWNAKDPK